MIQLRNQGMVLGEDSEKMSKSRGNVVAPDDLVRQYGADTVRAYLIFFTRWEMGGPWSSTGIEGTARWLRRVWAIFHETPNTLEPAPDTIKQLRRKLHQTLRNVTHDFEHFEFNTIVSGLMELMNEMYKAFQNGAGNSPVWQEVLETYVLMMAPICPHMAEELWMKLEKPYSVHQQAWPVVDEVAAAQDEITLVVQVNGKVKDRITVAAGISQEDARSAALSSEAIQKTLEGREPRQVIVVPGRLVNIVL
jgi:leucyl-tRNA synthetase